jgi:hypothetical protein
VLAPRIQLAELIQKIDLNLTSFLQTQERHDCGVWASKCLLYFVLIEWANMRAVYHKDKKIIKAVLVEGRRLGTPPKADPDHMWVMFGCADYTQYNVDITAAHYGNQNLGEIQARIDAESDASLFGDYKQTIVENNESWMGMCQEKNAKHPTVFAKDLWFLLKKEVEKYPRAEWKSLTEALFSPYCVVQRVEVKSE